MGIASGRRLLGIALALVLAVTIGVVAVVRGSVSGAARSTGATAADVAPDDGWPSGGGLHA